MTVFERFTSGARQAVTDAQGEARRLGHRYIGTEHLLLGLLAGGDGIAAAVLRDAGIDASTVERDVVRIVGRGPGSGREPGATAPTPLPEPTPTPCGSSASTSTPCGRRPRPRSAPAPSTGRASP